MKKHFKLITFIIKRTTIIILLVALLHGCVTSLALNKKKSEEKTRLQETLRIAQNTANEKQQHEGSLWDSSGTLNELFVNDKARRAGDIVTIKVVEESEAQNKATTKTGRDSSLLAKLTSFLGLAYILTSGGMVSVTSLWDFSELRWLQACTCGISLSLLLNKN